MKRRPFLICFAAAAAQASVPEHIVIVIEENRSISHIIGYEGAPFLNRIAAEGALLTDFYALTHPSQPNYIHFFAGAHLGVRDNEVPQNLPFDAPNLGAGLLGAGHSFASFSEDLPFPGFDGATSGWYARKHNPSANWQAANPQVHQFPLSLNRPFTAFPTDFSQLPTVSIVIPNLINDMHDGTVEQGDAWLSANIGPFADWAMQNNSLLIITWDEDEFEQRNLIPTMLYGPMIRPGLYPSTYTLHNLLRTLCDLYNVPPPGAAASVAPITGIFRGDPNVQSVRFRRTIGGHTVRDTYLDSTIPNASRGPISPMLITALPAITQGLVRFDSFIGRDAGKVPPGAEVVSAKLKLLTDFDDADFTLGEVALHRMIRPWAENATWNSMGAGIQLDGIEASPSAEFVLTPDVSDAWAVFDVTRSVQEMVLNPASNQGWVLIPRGGDNWRALSSESRSSADRPTLEVTFIAPLCDGDLTADGDINDSDFMAFARSYDILTVPPASAFADLNADNAVDDADFVLFIAAYHRMFCD